MASNWTVAYMKLINENGVFLHRYENENKSAGLRELKNLSRMFLCAIGWCYILLSNTIKAYDWTEFIREIDTLDWFQKDIKKYFVNYIWLFRDMIMIVMFMITIIYNMWKKLGVNPSLT